MPKPKKHATKANPRKGRRSKHAPGASVCKQCLAEGVAIEKCSFDDAARYDQHMDKHV